MRAAPLLVLLTGCASLLGIDDPGIGGGACEPYAEDQGCEDDQTCDLDPDDGLLECRAIGDGQPLDLCFPGQECASDLSCVDGVCRSMCEDAADCRAGEVACIQQVGPNLEITVCDSDCDVLVNGGPLCPVGTECILNLNQTGDPFPTCVPDGWFGDLPLGDDCFFLNACEQGLGCYDDDSDGTGSCTELCEETAKPCPGGRTCVDVLDPVHEVNVGLCALE
jgi:hypothetical protein